MKRLSIYMFFALLSSLLTACSIPIKSLNSNGLANNLAVPEIKETKGVKQLYVNNEPYLILGGELLNSSASSIEHMEDIWEHVRSLNVNTVYLPITWQQFEPQEGTIDYSLIDSHIKNAYDNDLKL
nr:beta-galactosidase [Spirochaetales bacterium]